jgi:hypothetical protein
VKTSALFITRFPRHKNNLQLSAGSATPNCSQSFALTTRQKQFMRVEIVLTKHAREICFEHNRMPVINSGAGSLQSDSHTDVAG